MFSFALRSWMRVAEANKAQISIDKRQFRKIIIRFPVLTVLKEYKMNLELILFIHFQEETHPQTSIDIVGTIFFIALSPNYRIWQVLSPNTIFVCTPIHPHYLGLVTGTRKIA